MQKHRFTLLDNLALVLMIAAVALAATMITLAACGARSPLPEGEGQGEGLPVRATALDNLVDTTVLTNLYVEDDVTVADDLVVVDDISAPDLTVTDRLTVTTGISTPGDISIGDDLVVSGDVVVGDGTATVAQDGEDFYIEGNIEVDGTTYFDGDVEAHARLTIMDSGGFQVENATNEGVVLAVTYVITYSMDGAQQTVGVVPAYSDVLDWFVVVETAFDDTGTDLLTCGISTDTDLFVDDVDGSSTGRNFAGYSAEMQLDEWSTAHGDVGSSDVTVVCQYDGANSDMSAGSATFVLWYRVD